MNKAREVYEKWVGLERKQIAMRKTAVALIEHPSATPEHIAQVTSTLRDVADSLRTARPRVIDALQKLPNGQWWLCKLYDNERRKS